MNKIVRHNNLLPGHFKDGVGIYVPEGSGFTIETIFGSFVDYNWGADHSSTIGLIAQLILKEAVFDESTNLMNSIEQLLGSGTIRPDSTHRMLCRAGSEGVEVKHFYVSPKKKIVEKKFKFSDPDILVFKRFDGIWTPYTES